MSALEWVLLGVPAYLVGGMLFALFFPGIDRFMSSDEEGASSASDVAMFASVWPTATIVFGFGLLYIGLFAFFCKVAEKSGAEDTTPERDM